MEMMGSKIRLCEPTFVCIVIALASPGVAKSQEHSQLVDTGVIFSAKQVERLAKSYHILKPPYWTPSTEEIARLEVQLKPYLEGVTTPKAKVIAAKLGHYKRQYLGYTVGGKKWIFVNSFCSWTEDESWRDTIIIVKDGGACFFSVRYDVSRSQFNQLQINGPT